MANAFTYRGISPKPSNFHHGPKPVLLCIQLTHSPHSKFRPQMVVIATLLDMGYWRWLEEPTRIYAIKTVGLTCYTYNIGDPLVYPQVPLSLKRS